MTFPQFFAPQLATLSTVVPGGSQWVYELKYDGYRILARVDRGKVELITRNGKDWTRYFPTIVLPLKKLRFTSTIFDGELCALNRAGKIDFQSLQRSVKEQFERKNGAPDSASSYPPDVELRYFIFDAPFLSGKDLRHETYNARRQRLEERVSPRLSLPLALAEQLQGSPSNLLKASCKKGLEGIIAKNGDARYFSKRTRDWLKIKCSGRQEFVIGGYTDHSSSRNSIGALLLGTVKGGQLKYAGKVGTGFDTSERASLFKLLSKLTTRHSPFAERPKERGEHWVEPVLVGEVSFSEWTNEGRLRHPVFKGLRADKKAGDVVREGEEAR